MTVDFGVDNVINKYPSLDCLSSGICIKVEPATFVCQLDASLELCFIFFQLIEIKFKNQRNHDWRKIIEEINGHE